MMKNIKTFEYYYDKYGKVYTDGEFEDLPNSAFSNNKYYYIHEKLEKFIPELIEMKNRLSVINDEMEKYGPIDDDIQEIIDSFYKLLKKWNETTLNQAVKKYNI
jgi:hypothetical protein